MRLVEPHPEYALARRDGQTSQLLVLIRDHFTTKDFAFCRVEHRELSGSHGRIGSRLRVTNQIVAPCVLISTAPL